jgi:hypothetical protein
MGRGSFAHVLLAAAGAFLIVSVIAFGGWEGWLGSGIQATFKHAVTSGWEVYRVRKDELEIAGKAAGALFTAVTGIFYLAKAYHYAERNLPNRLEDFIERCGEKILGERDQLIGALTAQPNAAKPPKLLAGIKKTYRLDAYLRKVEADKSTTSLIPEPMLRQLDERLSVLEKHLSINKQQKATALIVRGLERVRAMESAAQLPEASNWIGQRDLAPLRREAVDYFELAAKLDATDPRPSEYAALQCVALHDYERALRFVQTWQAVNKTTENGLDIARATRCEAAILCSKAVTDPTLTQTQKREKRHQAKNMLDSSISELINLSSAEQLLAKPELAATYEALGLVRLEIVNGPKGRATLGTALRLYEELGDKAASARISKRLHSSIEVTRNESSG